MQAAETVGPVLVHVVTDKGHGYSPAETSQDKMHGVVKFDPKTGKQFTVRLAFEFVIPSETSTTLPLCLCLGATKFSRSLCLCTCLLTHFQCHHQVMNSRLQGRHMGAWGA